MRKNFFEFFQFVPRLTCFVEGAGEGGGGSVTQQAAAALSAPDPAPVAAAPPNPDPAAPLTPAPPTNDPAPPDAPPMDPLAALDDLAKAETDADPNAALEQLKDNPRVQELLALDSMVQKAMQSSPYIQEPANIENAVADATVLWGIIDGKVPASALLDAVKETNPAAFAQMVPQLVEYLQKQTGQPIAANAAGKSPDPSAVNDPAMKELQEIKAKFAQREQQEAQVAMQKRVDAAGQKLQSKVAELVKDKWAPGMESGFMQAVQQAFAGKDEQLIAQIERGDYRGVERAVRSALSAKIKEVQAVNKWLIARKQTTLAAIPKQAAGGAPAAPASAPKNEFDPKKLTAEAVAALQG